MSEAQHIYSGKGSRLTRKIRPQRLNCPIHGPKTLHFMINSIGLSVCRECVHAGQHEARIIREVKRSYHHYYYYNLQPQRNGDHPEDIS
jgi:hypothetical protein